MIRKVIDKAVTACENSKNGVSDHFVEVNKTIDMPKSATKDILDYELSRYACYLIVQKKVNKKTAPVLPTPERLTYIPGWMQ